MALRLLVLLPVAIFAVVAGAFLWGLKPERNAREVPSALIDRPVPDFDLPPVEGVDLPGLKSADLEGRVSLVNFFASWCVPCRVEHPLLMELAQQGEINLVGVNYRDKPEDATAWLADLGNPYRRIGADLAARTGIDWGVSGVPETFVVDAEGRVRYQQIGPIMPDQWRDKLQPLLKGLQP